MDCSDHSRIDLTLDALSFKKTLNDRLQVNISKDNDFNIIIVPSKSSMISLTGIDADVPELLNFIFSLCNYPCIFT